MRRRVAPRALPDTQFRCERPIGSIARSLEQQTERDREIVDSAPVRVRPVVSGLQEAPKTENVELRSKTRIPSEVSDRLARAD